MVSGTPTTPCNCAALRRALRVVTQLYDGHLSSVGLRTTQFSILSSLSRHGPLSMQALAELLVLDRTTLTRTLAPLERDGLVETRPGQDRRFREVAITKSGESRRLEALPLWEEAQRKFEGPFGKARAAELRRDLQWAVDSTMLVLREGDAGGEGRA